jgi:hypothetical protein
MPRNCRRPQAHGSKTVLAMEQNRTAVAAGRCGKAKLSEETGSGTALAPGGRLQREPDPRSVGRTN